MLKSKSEHRLKFFSLFFIVFLVVAGTVLYSGTLVAGFHLDDFRTIVLNDAIDDPGDFVRIAAFNPRRIIGTYTFAVNRAFTGADPAGFHIVNILIHILASIVVYLLSTRLAESKPIGSPLLSARIFGAFCALVFISHPIQTQAVTYIVQRYASLMSLMYLGALLAYVQARISTGRRRIAWFAVASILAIAAMFTKETALTIPFAVALLECYFFSDSPRSFLGKLTSQRAWYVIAPGLLITSLVTYLAVRSLGNLFPSVVSQRYGDPLLTPAVYLATQFTVIPRYLMLLLFPAGQTIDHDVPAADSFADPAVAGGMLFIFLLLAGVIFLYRRNRLVSFGIAWFLTTLMIESSIWPLGNVMFEHRLYLPMFGFALALTGTVAHIGDGRIRTIGFTALAAAVVAFGWLTVTRNMVWGDEITLWSDAIRKAPHKSRPYHCLALAYQQEGDVVTAERLYREALSRNPDNEETLNNLGLILIGKKEYIEAGEVLSHALELEPDTVATLNSMATLSLALGRNDTAASYLRRALEREPDSAETHANLGYMLFLTGKINAAERHLDTAISLDPGIAAAHVTRGRIFLSRGDTTGADKEFSVALGLEPHNPFAWYERGNIFVGSGSYDKAAACFRNARTHDPTFLDAYRNEGNVLLTLGRTGEALEIYRRGLDVSPGNRSLGKNYAIALSIAGEDSLALIQITDILAGGDDFEARYLAGEIALKRKEYEKAERHLLAAAAMKPGSPDIHRMLATCYRALGNAAQAARHQSRADSLSR